MSPPAEDRHRAGSGFAPEPCPTVLARHPPPPHVLGPCCLAAV